MSKAEERALEAYPLELDSKTEYNSAMRVGFKIGYHQAEKDLALKDIDIINVGKHIRESAGHQVVYLDEVWHDASDVRPERLEPLLIDDGIQFVIGDKTCVEETDKWCYITDILPNKQ